MRQLAMVEALTLAFDPSGSSSGCWEILRK